MKIRIDSDEWYPWYMEARCPVEYCDGEIEVTEEEYARMKFMWKEANEIHDLIRSRLEQING